MGDSYRSDALLQQIQGRYNEKTVEMEEEKISILIFQLGEYLFGFPGLEAREIVPFSGAVWIPGTTAVLPGVINLRGDVVAVLDLKQLLGIVQNDTAAFLIMLRSGDGRTGIQVDRIVDVTEISAASNGPVLATMDERFRRYAVSQFECGHDVVTVLGIPEIMASIDE